MTTHERVAREIASSPDLMPLQAGASARQGDLLLRRVGDTIDNPVPNAGTLLVAGSHGEHWAVGATALSSDTLVVGAGGAVVVHTDVPTARHQAISLAPGCWQIGVQRELGSDQIVRKVVD